MEPNATYEFAGGLLDGLMAVPVHHPTKPSAASLLNIGKTLAWEMAADGRLPTIRLGGPGGRVVVPVEALRRMLEHP